MSESIKKMFGRIAKRYDLINDLFSFGLHRFWRRKAVKISGAARGDFVLDLACGTGDFANRFYKITGKVTGIDFSEEMIDISKQKYPHIEFFKGDALNIDFPDSSFDISSISFGIRNVDSTDRCLSEMARVVKTGGKIVILEFGQPLGLFSIFFRIYSKYIMPFFGKFVTGSKSSFVYLYETSAKYPCREDFIKIMNDSDSFSEIKYHTLALGIAFVYIGRVR